MKKKSKGKFIWDISRTMIFDRTKKIKVPELTKRKLQRLFNQGFGVELEKLVRSMVKSSEHQGHKPTTTLN
ncbi:hypothetical protein KY285_024040 [Solanum tuberosum]|nr:hypothetical protein KY285_024040 [Solanum tuberosum]